MNWYLKVLKQYADFNGRARRIEFWMFVLFNFIAGSVLNLIDFSIGTYGILSGLYGLAVLIPALAVSVRRLHDIGKSGWMLLIVFIPIIGAIWLIVLYCLESDPLENQYGPNPNAMKKFEPFKRKKSTNYPFSSENNSSHSGDQDREDQEVKKTKIGLQSDLPYIDSSDDSESVIKCPNCEYPLRTEPSVSSPCPNCGFTDAKASIHDTKSDSAKTINVGSLVLKDEAGASSLKFILYDETLNSEIKIESGETELVLNRDHLDPENMSISSDQHVAMKIKEGSIYLSDVSSNQSTFISGKNKTPISVGSRLVIGNKIFLFDLKGNPNQAAGNKSTMKIGQFDVQNDSIMTIALTEEVSGQCFTFQGEKIIINRSNIDPSNSSISSKEHVVFSYESGTWYMQDVSTNGATFKQVTGEVGLKNKTKIIIGNKVFRFEYL